MKDRANLVTIVLCTGWCAGVWAMLGQDQDVDVQIAAPVVVDQDVDVQIAAPVVVDEEPPGEGGLPQIREFGLRAQPVDEVVAEVLKTPQSRRWIAVFSLGEQVGRHYGRDLKAAAGIASKLPAKLQVVFYNGLGHTAPWDVGDLEAQVADIEAKVPESCRDGLWIGILIRYAKLHGNEPEDVVAFAEPFASEHGVDPVDGVRIGVQLKYRDRPARALALLFRYPLDYQSAMAEEIGWRVGSDIGLQPERVLPLAKDLSSQSRPRFFHGFCRAAWSPSVSISSLRPLLEALDQSSQNQCLEAIGFALAQLGRSAQEVRTAASGLGDPVLAQRLQKAHGRFEGGTHGWENADLRPPVPSAKP